ncbi:type II toxin-antitoxin system VapC family toxin [Sphingobacterium daejeonense]|uniref:Type II toxin-antitoxin system VapC family toxin n=1 Tax=Sphingobacterium daejeonense TaxID=371142 RepID=A0ABW3RQX3_9SPHI
MGKTRYLIDSNPIIDYLAYKIPPKGMQFMNNVLNNAPRISIISKIEILSFNTSPHYYKILTNFVEELTIIHLSDEVVDKCIELRKNHKTKLADAIIAATSIVHNLDIITRNKSDFKNINGINLIDAHRI